jgi:hypothetical protein
MNELLTNVLDRFTGLGPVAVQDSSDSNGADEPDAALYIATNLPKAAAQDLVRCGYTIIHRFSVLPSLRAPRWLLPLGGGTEPAKAFQIYAPYSSLGRILKNAFLVTQKGWHSWKRIGVVVASKGPLPLESMVQQATGEPHPVFALSLGTPNRFRKIVAQVMRPNGEILGYIKLPLSEAADERIRNEAAVLSKLWECEPLRPQIPRVLYAGKMGSFFILFQSAGPNHPGPVEFNSLHESFLNTLKTIQSQEKPGESIAEQVASRWRNLETLVDSGLRATGEYALELARQDLMKSTIFCGLSHGDFAPWNTRVGDGRLFVFDWESATDNTPLLWDRFHYHVQVASLLNKTSGVFISTHKSLAERGLFLLYILSSACQLIEEGANGDQHPGIAWRRKLLTAIYAQ